LIFFVQFVLKNKKKNSILNELPVLSRPEMLSEGRKEGKKDMKDSEKTRI
jgi:hypothetical protein